MNKKLLPIIMLSLCVTACGDDVSDLQAFTEEVKANAQPSIEPMPKIKEYKSFEYSVENLRSPFVKPKPELVEDTTTLALDCLQPDFSRNREALEKFPLDTITMRGTLGETGKLFALTSVAGGAIYRVQAGNYMGLFHGKIDRITSDKIILTEMIPDGTGCWETRKAEISIFGKGTNSGSQRNEN